MLRMQHAQRYGFKIGFKGFKWSDHKTTKKAENPDQESVLEESNIGLNCFSFKDNEREEEHFRINHHSHHSQREEGKEEAVVNISISS